MKSLVNYHIIKKPEDIQPPITGVYEYLFAGNGVFARAKRPNLEATIPVTVDSNDRTTLGVIHGLARVETLVNIPKIPGAILEKLYLESLKAAPNEILFWLLYGEAGWEIFIPDQFQSQTRVRPKDQYHPKLCETLVEVHSHHSMPPVFSPIDNEEEQGFKAYVVLGDFGFSPALRCRVGIFGHFCEIPANWLFESLPENMRDNLEDELTLKQRERHEKFW